VIENIDSTLSTDYEAISQALDFPRVIKWGSSKDTQRNPLREARRSLEKKLRGPLPDMQARWAKAVVQSLRLVERHHGSKLAEARLRADLAGLESTLGVRDA
jgi:hypothetical protein